MRILLIADYQYNQHLSIPRFVSLLDQGLADAGHEVKVLRPPPVFGRLRPGNTGVSKWLGYVDRFLLFRKILQREVEWADVVHICVECLYASWLKSKPHVLTCHDVIPIRSALGQVPENPVRFSGRIYQRLGLRGLQDARMVICVSEQTRKEWLQLGGQPERTCVVYNALNYPYRPMPLNEARERLERLGVSSAPYVLHVGGNQWYKNRPGVVRIFSALVRRSGFNQHRLVIVGRPLPMELRDWLTDQGLKERLVETGMVENEDLRALYTSADLLLFPSLMEGFGWPIAEAQACGCPVATTNRPPMTEVGGDGAIYIDPENPEAAAATIAASWSRRADLLRRGFRNVERFSVSSMIAGYLDAYREVISRGKA